MSEEQRRWLIIRLICVYMVFLMPHAINGDRWTDDRPVAAFEVIHSTKMSSSEDTVSPPAESSIGSRVANSSAFSKSLRGVYTKAGSIQSVGGALVNFPACEGDDDEFLETRKPDEDWIAVMYYPPPCQSNDTTANSSECLHVLDRVKNAMLFGASAIIILTMNPNIIRELDIAKQFPFPIVGIHEFRNMTFLMKIIRSGLNLKIRVKVMYGPYCDTQTFTVWSTCWRARPGSGVVCMSDSRLSKANPSLFWSYFYSALAVIMLLLLIKTNRRWLEDGGDEMEQEFIGAAAWKALSFMKIKRYRISVCKYDDSERDTCAICLELFYNRQRIRILPCSHEFHTKCVDPWLVRHPQCPLCTLNIMGTKHNGTFLQNFGW